VVALLLIGAFVALNLFWKVDEGEGNIGLESIPVFSTPRDNVLRIDVSVEDESFAFIRTDTGWVLEGKEDVKIKI
jgi:hypothetical protein